MVEERCPDCEGKIVVPEDVLLGEIVSCPDCGLDFEIKEVNGGKVQLVEVAVEKEDWGE